MANERLIQKFLNDRRHITIDDCARILTAFGYKLRRGSGSHRTFHKQGGKPITIVTPKKSRYVISPYVNKIIRDLKLEE